jgi:hypothetical protein
MVGTIPLNLRSQETVKGVPHAHARAPPPAGPSSGRALRGSFNSGLNLSVACLFVSCMRETLVLQLPISWRTTCDPSPSAFLRERLSRGEPLALGTREQNLQNHSPAESAGASEALAIRDLARGIDN